jgi:hypothetical protein
VAEKAAHASCSVSGGRDTERRGSRCQSTEASSLATALRYHGFGPRCPVALVSTAQDSRTSLPGASGSVHVINRFRPNGNRSPASRVMMPSSTAVGRARDRASARSPSGGRRPLRRRLRRRLDPIQPNSAAQNGFAKMYG